DDQVANLAECVAVTVADRAANQLAEEEHRDDHLALASVGRTRADDRGRQLGGHPRPGLGRGRAQIRLSEPVSTVDRAFASLRAPRRDCPGRGGRVRLILARARYPRNPSGGVDLRLMQLVPRASAMPG